MSYHLIEQLEAKINNILTSLEAMRSQIETLEANNINLQAENMALKNRQAQWEQGLSTLLHKLDEAAFIPNKMDLQPSFEKETLDALV